MHTTNNQTGLYNVKRVILWSNSPKFDILYRVSFDISRQPSPAVPAIFLSAPFIQSFLYYLSSPCVSYFSFAHDLSCGFLSWIIQSQAHQSECGNKHCCSSGSRAVQFAFVLLIDSLFKESKAILIGWNQVWLRNPLSLWSGTYDNVISLQYCISPSLNCLAPDLIVLSCKLLWSLSFRVINRSRTRLI